MSSDWNSCTLGEFVRLQRGHDLTAAEQVAGSVPIMGSAGPNGFHNKSLAKGPGVVIGRSGASAGRVHYCETDYWPHNTCLYVTDFLGNNPKFAYYLLQTVDLASFNSGSAQASLNRNFLYSIPLLVPCLEEQAELVAILSALDDRITLLRNTNETLDAIAQALFKSWFVDFDPVRAKSEGKLPEGMDAATASLFPDAFEETELGMVPRGWGVNSLSAFITECSSRIGAEQAIVLSAVQTGNLVMSSDFFNKRVHSKDISKYKAVQPYSYAYNPSRINIGSIGMNEMGTVGAVSPIYVVFNPNDIAYGYYLWHLLKINRIRELIKTMSSGTVRQSLSFKDFASIKVALPTAEIVQNFFEMRHEIFKAILEKEERISLLTNLRDTLLPPLITGQMRISEAKAELEKVIA